MTMRTMSIRMGGLKREANFDLRIGEPMVFITLTKGTRIQYKGRILAIEGFKNKLYVRLCFAHASDMDFQKLSDYLVTLSQGRKYWSKRGLPVSR